MHWNGTVGSGVVANWQLALLKMANLKVQLINDNRSHFSGGLLAALLVPIRMDVVALNSYVGRI